MLKFCDYCNTTYDYSDKDCKNKCREKIKGRRDKKRHKAYDSKRENNHIYKSKAWIRVRKRVMTLDNKLCLWSYYKDKRVVKGRVVHHIVPLSDDSSKAYDTNNLVFLSDKAHSHIHELYKDDKKKVQRELFDIINAHRQGVY